MKVFALFLMTSGIGMAQVDWELPFSIQGQGKVTERSHPQFPGHFHEIDCRLEMKVDLARQSAKLTFSYREADRWVPQTYYFRAGHIYQVDEDGKATPASSFGDLELPAMAILHPKLLDLDKLMNPQNHSSVGVVTQNSLWRKTGDGKTFERAVFSDVHGDGLETLTHNGNAVMVTREDSRLFQMSFEAPRACETFSMPESFHEIEAKSISKSEIALKDVGEGLYLIDLVRLNTRVFVVEFDSFLVVYEGAYSSQNVQLIAEKLETELKKPVKYFAFSHLHDQYIAGIRTWVERGATILAPESTKPLIEKVVNAAFSLNPDALAANPKPLNILVVDRNFPIEDAEQKLVFWNIDSQHTKDYLIFHLPRQKVVGSGDLLFYRPGQALKGRSLKFCETLSTLELDVETVYATWPLSGYGTKNVVEREELGGYIKTKSDDGLAE